MRASVPLQPQTQMRMPAPVLVIPGQAGIHWVWAKEAVDAPRGTAWIPAWIETRAGLTEDRLTLNEVALNLSCGAVTWRRG